LINKLFTYPVQRASVFSTFHLRQAGGFHEAPTLTWCPADYLSDLKLISGRPRGDKKAVERALRLYESKDYSAPEITELTGVSQAKLYRRLKEQSA